MFYGALKLKFKEKYVLLYVCMKVGSENMAKVLVN